MNSNKKPGIQCSQFHVTFHICNISFIFYFFCTEIITLSSRESSDVTYPMRWSEYFPKVEDSTSDSSKDEMKFYQQKKGSSSNKVEASKSLTSKQSAKLAFADRIKVLGLPNMKNCDAISIKPVAVKNPKEEQKFDLDVSLGLFIMVVRGLCMS